MSIIRSCEDGTYNIDRKTFWAVISIIITVIGSIALIFGEFVSAQATLEQQQKEIDVMKPALQSTQQNVAVLNEQVGSIDKKLTRIDEKLDKLIEK